MPLPYFCLSAIVLLINVSGCQTPDASSHSGATADPTTPPDMHTSRDALDWAGSYEGHMPCADCEAIETVITLLESGRYHKSSLYKGRSTEVFSETGRFEWADDGGRITLYPEEGASRQQQYRVGEDRLFHLDADGRRITGELAERYILHRIRPPLEGKKWYLSKMGELEVIPVDEDARAYILFEKGRLQAWAGCNRLSADYQLHSGLIIQIGAVGGTKMACSDMESEQALTRILERTQRYMISSRTLHLYGPTHDLLAIFHAE